MEETKENEINSLNYRNCEEYIAINVDAERQEALDSLPFLRTLITNCQLTPEWMVDVGSSSPSLPPVSINQSTLFGDHQSMV